jgi:superfamily II DNA or RNA helicase
MELRDYQQEIKEKILANYASGIKSQMLVLPTGGGKTVLFSAIAKHYLEQGKAVLMVCHREELIHQGVAKLKDICGVFPGIIKAGYQYTPSPIQVGSVQTMGRRTFRPEAGLLIIDEAHHATAKSYSSLIDHYKANGADILGVTATPSRCDGYGFNHLFDELVEVVNVRSLIADGYLSKYRLYAGFTRYTNGRLFGKDYTAKELEEVATCLDPSLLVDEYLKFNKKAVVFAANVAHSRAIAQAFQDKGIKAEHLDGQTPNDDRLATLERFKSSQTTVITNCGILTEGFDCPDIELIQLARPTTSVSLYLQMVGRALRPSDGKTEAIIIDHTANWKVHGLPDTDRQWTLQPQPVKSNGMGVAECPECGHVFIPNVYLAETKTFINGEGELVKLNRSKCPGCGHHLDWIKTKPASAKKDKQETEVIEPVAIPDLDFQEVPLECNLDFLIAIAALKKSSPCKYRKPDKRRLHYYRDFYPHLLENHAITIKDIQMAADILKIGSDVPLMVHRAIYPSLIKCTTWVEVEQLMANRPECIKKALWHHVPDHVKAKLRQMKQRELSYV